MDGRMQVGERRVSVWLFLTTVVEVCCSVVITDGVKNDDELVM